MNLPNKLTVARLILVVPILVLMILPYSVAGNVIALAVFSAASLTDLLDGKIARKYGLITDFGKFLDPLADKFMVIAAIFGLVCRGFREGNEWLFWVFMVMLIVTIFRELAVASIRLVASTTGGVVVPANMLGKLKTVFQMSCIIVALLEPIVHQIIAHFAPDFFFYGFYALTYLLAAVSVVLTVISGYVYLKTYWGYLDPAK